MRAIGKVTSITNILFSFFLIFNVVSVDLGCCCDRPSTLAGFIEMLASASCSIVHSNTGRMEPW